jgi:hypothetical protein
MPTCHSCKKKHDDKIDAWIAKREAARKNIK